MSYYPDDDNYDGEYDELDYYQDSNDVVDDVIDTYNKFSELENQNVNNNSNGQNKSISSDISDVANNTKKAKRAKEEVEAAKRNAENMKKAEAAEKAAKVGETAAKAGETAAKTGETAAKAGEAAAAVGEGATAAGKTASGPVGWVLLGLDLLRFAAKKAKEEREKRKNEDTSKKVKRFLRKNFLFIILISVPAAIFFALMLFFSVGTTVTTQDSSFRLYDFVDCMQTDEVCSDILDLEIELDDDEEEIVGFNKPLISFNNAEYKKLVETYMKFSDKNFEFGEGILNENYDDIEKDLNGIKEKEELDATILINFLTIEARAFSRIKWIAVEEGTERVLEDDEDFDIIYDSSNDASDLSAYFQKFFDFFGQDEYQIKIPKVSKYSVTNSWTAPKEKVTMSGLKIIDNGGAKVTTNPSKITDEYIQKQLDGYIDLVRDYLPQWYEPYAIYLSTGDVTYAKAFFDEYMAFINSEEESNLVIKLYKLDLNSECWDKVDTTTTSVVKGATTVDGPNEVITETISHSDYYSPAVERGADSINGIQLSSGMFPKASPAGKVENVKVNETTYSSGDIYESLETGEVDGNGNKKTQSVLVGYYTQKRVENMKVKTLEGWEVGAEKPTFTKYEMFFEDTSYANKKIDYLNMRTTLIFYRLCKSYLKDKNQLNVKETEFDLGLIGPALEIVYELFTNPDPLGKEGKPKNAVDIYGDNPENQDIPGTGVSPKKTSDIKNGWSHLHTTSSGKTYKSYKQNQESAYYYDKTYLGKYKFSDAGCPLTAAAIMLSMLGKDIDPYTLYAGKNGKGGVGAQTPDKAINTYLGKNLYTVTYNIDKELIKRTVQAGKPVGIHVGNDWDSLNQHYMVITDYDEKTGKFYVEGVHTSYTTGWLPLESIKEINTGQRVNALYVPN